MNDSAVVTNKDILITGGLGFIGANLACRLVDSGNNVTLVDSLIPEYGGNLFNVAGFADRVRINISDVRDMHSMRYLVQGCDLIFNLAGQTSHVDSMINPHVDMEINAAAQLSILEACRHHNPEAKIIFASTRQIYGKAEYLPVDEKHPIRPVDVNGINKVAGESYHLLYNDVYGLRACCLRLTNTYGPRMRIKDARQTFLGIWLRNLVQNKPVEIWGGDQLRDFTFVSDVIDAMLLAAQSDAAIGQVFNLGGHEVVSLKELGRLLVEVNGGGELALQEFPAERKKIDIGDYFSDFSKIKAALGWVPKVALREGIQQSLEFYRTNLDRYL